MKKTLLSTLALIALGGVVTSCGKEQKDAPQPAGNTSARATELHAGETITGSIQTDSLALVDLYKSLDGMGWSHSNNWNSSRPVATWAGVQVSDVAGAPRVTALYLGGNKRDAEAEVPMELLELGNLVGPESYVKERIAAFREAGVTNLQVIPVADDAPALISKVKEWVS